MQILSKYEHGKYIHEHGNQSNEWSTQICIENTEDCNIVIPMYNLFGYSDNYSIKSGS